jgi:hypothetical protein
MRISTEDLAKRALLTGWIAGTLATVAQLLFWLAFTKDLPDILYRDTRMAAAILLGPGVLAAKMSPYLWVVAGVLHFSLSILYAGIIVLATARLRFAARLLAGVLAGAAIHVINMYGFTNVFPWFAASRDPITFAAHLVFGMCAAVDWLAPLRSQTKHL